MDPIAVQTLSEKVYRTIINSFAYPYTHTQFFDTLILTVIINVAVKFFETVDNVPGISCMHPCDLT